ncbi:hypothetical protein [Rhodococcus spongiicola]|uniref:hypothetical protein n=1 Tax=Rhodococcus spongiicola TaxID=2487352 RepID=UPI0026CA75A3
MTDAQAPPQADTLPAAGLRRVLAILCLTEITSWGILYYAFPVLSVTGSYARGYLVLGAIALLAALVAAASVPRRAPNTTP